MHWSAQCKSVRYVVDGFASPCQVQMSPFRKKTPDFCRSVVVMLTNNFHIWNIVQGTCFKTCLREKEIYVMFSDFWNFPLWFNFSDRLICTFGPSPQNIDKWAACLKGSLLCCMQAHDTAKALEGRAVSLLGTFTDIDTVDCSSCGEQSELIKVGFGLDLGVCCDLFLEFKISHVIFQMWN